MMIQKTGQFILASCRCVPAAATALTCSAFSCSSAAASLALTSLSLWRPSSDPVSEASASPIAEPERPRINAPRSHCAIPAHISGLPRLAALQPSVAPPCQAGEREDGAGSGETAEHVVEPGLEAVD